jgi:hypothetical protein
MQYKLIYLLYQNKDKSIQNRQFTRLYLSILSVHDDGYSRNASCALNWISTFYCYHWVDTSPGGLLVPEGIIRPVVSVSALTWFIRYIYYWNLQFLNNVIIDKTKVLLPQT